MRHLRNIIFAKGVLDDWSDYCPLVQRIFNATDKDTLGCTPAQLLFGNAVHLDRAMYKKDSDDCTAVESKSLSEYSSKMLDMQAKLIMLAQNNQSAHNEQHIANSQSERTEFPINSYVLVNHPQNNLLNKGAPTKMHPNRKGPLRVVNFSGNKYVLQDLVTNKCEDYHVTLLSPFNYDPNEVNLKDIANKDYHLREIDKIVAHEGVASRRFDLRFLCSWSDEPDVKTWLSYKELKNNAKMHEYLIANRLRSALPQRYKRLLRDSKADTSVQAASVKPTEPTYNPPMEEEATNNEGLRSRPRRHRVRKIWHRSAV